MRWILAIGAVLGALSVALWAYAVHQLRPGMLPERYDNVMVAIRMMQMHAVVLVAVGFGAQAFAKNQAAGFGVAAVLMMAGILLFSGGLLLAALTPEQGFLKMAPLGGNLVIISWLALAVAAFRKPKT